MRKRSFVLLNIRAPDTVSRFRGHILYFRAVTTPRTTVLDWLDFKKYVQKLPPKQLVVKGNKKHGNVHASREVFVKDKSDNLYSFHGTEKDDSEKKTFLNDHFF